MLSNIYEYMYILNNIFDPLSPSHSLNLLTYIVEPKCIKKIQKKVVMPSETKKAVIKNQSNTGQNLVMVIRTCYMSLNSAVLIFLQPTITFK